MNQAKIEEQENTRTNRLANFVLRARRAERHSIAKELEELVVQNTLIRRDLDGVLRVSKRAASSEEALESMAAIIRPFTMKELDYKTLVKDVRRRLEASEKLTSDLLEELNMLSSKWQVGSEEERKQFDPNNLTVENYAWAWLYSDSIHADKDWLPVVEKSSYNQRFISASLIIARLAVLVISLLAIAREHKDTLRIPSSAFETDVHYDRRKHSEETVIKNFYIGPPGIDVSNFPDMTDEELKARGFTDYAKDIAPSFTPIELLGHEVYAISFGNSIMRQRDVKKLELDKLSWLDFTFSCGVATLHDVVNKNFPDIEILVKGLSAIMNYTNANVVIHASRNSKVTAFTMSPRP